MTIASLSNYLSIKVHGCDDHVLLPCLLYCYLCISSCCPNAIISCIVASFLPTVIVIWKTVISSNQLFKAQVSPTSNTYRGKI